MNHRDVFPQLSPAAIPAALIAAAFLLFPSTLRAGDPVYFDAPALAIAREVIPATPILSDEKMIEVVLPVSTQIQFANRNDIDEFRFDVRWNRMVYPLVEYGPRTQTVTSIEGTIAVERHDSLNSDFGVNVSVNPSGVATGSLKTLIDSRRGSSQRYNEIPQHEVLVASGTIQRGTGAFFRFHPSTTTTLEGGRDLVVAYRVPRTWQGGLLTVECRAHGQKEILGAWTEPVETARSFVVAVYLDGNDQARLAATEFVRRELSLQQRWEMDRESPSSAVFSGLFQSSSRQNERLPVDWAAVLIQSGTDDYFLRFEDRLPPALLADTQAFVEARNELLKYSR
ncbi:MAG: hypothetical protein AAF456_01835 [Planctomycetota bacterium]